MHIEAHSATPAPCPADDEDGGGGAPGGAGGDQQPPAAAAGQQQGQQPAYMLDAVEEDPDKELHAFEVDPAKVCGAGPGRRRSWAAQIPWAPTRHGAWRIELIGLLPSVGARPATLRLPAIRPPCFETLTLNPLRLA